MSVLVFSCNTIKNLRHDTAHIYGNCGMCKKTIENAGNKPNEAEVVWNKETKIANLSYDSTMTSMNEILQRIAKAGYDSDSFLAPDDTYNALKKCCQYDRNPRAIANNTQKPTDKIDTTIQTNTANPNIATTTEASKVVEPTNSITILKILDEYLQLKDALVKTDAKQASVKATALHSSLTAMNMNTLKDKEHTTWMAVYQSLQNTVDRIKSSKDIEVQRSLFATLYSGMYKLTKSTVNNKAIYVQHCPMALDGKGANWLSTEKQIKNPYYGSMMMNCGSVKETIK